VVTDVTAPTITCAADVTINTTPGLCSGTATLVPPTVNDNCSIEGGALLFDGVNDYVFGPDDVVPITGEYTVSVWAKQINNHPGQFRNIFAQGRNLYLGQSSTGFIRVGDNWYITDVDFPTDNQWHHYTIVRKTTDTHLYIDGALIASKGSSIPSPGVNGVWPHNLNIGTGWSGYELFDGQIDEMQIWNYALEQPQIACNMNQLLNGNEPGLVAYFNFEDGPGSTILSDLVTPAHNGTLTNMNVNTAWVASPVPSTDINLKNSFNNTCDASGTYPIGNTIVIWTATDAAGNTATCTQTVTVLDNESPTAICQNITVNLDTQGHVSIAPADVDGGSTDNCTVNYVSVVPSTFDCANLGENTVTLTINESSGNTATCTATVTVADPLHACCANPTDGGTISEDQTGCSPFDPTEITVTGPTSYTGTLEYTWQSSTTSEVSGFADFIPALTTSSYDPGSLTTTIWFKRLVKVTCESMWEESDVVKITVEHNPVSGTLSKTPDAANICDGTNVFATLTPAPAATALIRWLTAPKQEHLPGRPGQIIHRERIFRLRAKLPLKFIPCAKQPIAITRIWLL